MFVLFTVSSFLTYKSFSYILDMNLLLNICFTIFYFILCVLFIFLTISFKDSNVLGIWKGAQYLYLSRKCKSKLQGYITSLPLGCLLKKKKIKITNAGEDLEKKEPLDTTSRNGNYQVWHSSGKQYDSFTTKLKNTLLYDPNNPTSGYMHPKEMKSLSQRDISILVFITALFTMVIIEYILKSNQWWNKLER